MPTETCMIWVKYKKKQKKTQKQQQQQQLWDKYSE